MVKLTGLRSPEERQESPIYVLFVVVWEQASVATETFKWIAIAVKFTIIHSALSVCNPIILLSFLSFKVSSI